MVHKLKYEAKVAKSLKKRKVDRMQQGERLAVKIKRTNSYSSRTKKKKKKNQSIKAHQKPKYKKESNTG